jgi:hypothetical protein
VNVRLAHTANVLEKPRVLVARGVKTGIQINGLSKQPLSLGVSGRLLDGTDAVIHAFAPAQKA